MQIPSNADFWVSSSIAWFYVITNSLRGFTYIPQIVVAWRSRDGARSLSLLTWCAWLVAHVAAVLYGFVLRDAFFTFISVINCVGCTTVTVIAMRRRRQWKLASEAVLSLHPPPMKKTLWEVAHRSGGDAAVAYVARWGCNARWFAADPVAPSLTSAAGQVSREHVQRTTAAPPPTLASRVMAPTPWWRMPATPPSCYPDRPQTSGSAS